MTLTLPAATEVRHRWVGVGSSIHADARSAGAAAAIEARQGTEARLAVVFATRHYDLEALLAGITTELPDVPLVGCSTAGEIATDGPGDASVVVLALGGDGFSIATGRALTGEHGLRGAGAIAARCVDDVEQRAHTVLLLLTDGLAGDQQEIVRGAYGEVGAAVPLVGGCAGDDQQMVRTFQFHDGEVFTEAVVAAAISSDAPIGIGMRHGWCPVGDAMLVTSSDGTVVHTIGDRPALDAYLDHLDAPEEVRIDPVAFTHFAATRPLGLKRRDREEVRYIAGADFEARSLSCIAEVPQGGLVWIMEGDDASVLAATDGACADAVEPLAGEAPLALLAFDCIARKGVLGPGVEDEVRRIAAVADGAPVAGFYTYGEIARTRGSGGFHNQTLVVLALG